MGDPLHDCRSPSELAASGQVIELHDELHVFERLAEIVEADLAALDPDKLPANWRDALVSGELSFGFVAAHAKLPGLQGRAEVTVDAVCQRCLEPMRLPLAVDLRLAFGTAAAADWADDGDTEFWELEQETLRPLDVVEEALIMAMPLAALHVNDPTCRALSALAGEAGAKVKPFASLRSQMDDSS